MSNLLPKQIESTRTWQRRVRITAMIVFLGIISLFITAAALLPVYFYTKLVLMGVHDTESQILIPEESQEKRSIGQQRQTLIRTLRTDKELVEQLSLITSLPNASEIIKHVALLVMGITGVEMKSLSLNSDLEQGTVLFMISGKAISRSAIVDIKEVFESDDLITIIDFPIGNLTPVNGEYLFNISLESVLNNKKDE